MAKRKKKRMRGGGNREEEGGVRIRGAMKENNRRPI